AIAREQNLTRAAETLHLSQSAVSSQIKQLEEELGVRLFRRTSKSMLLTEAGQVLTGYARNVLKATEQLQQKGAALSQGISSSIVIGLNTDANFLRVSAINQRFRALLPDTSVTFLTCHSVDTMQKLSQGAIDLGFFYGDELRPGIDSCVISEVRTCVVVPTRLVPEREELTWERIAALPWVWVDNDFPFFRALQKSLDDHTTIPNQTVTAVDEQIVRELVSAGHGAAIMREDEARPLAEQGLVSIWSRGWGEIPLRLGWLTANGHERRVRDAIDVVQHAWRDRPVAVEGSLTDKYWS
ncbi:MAG: LysR family transcriptional regulator, partial [Desulfuromonadales bacterium]|nr:LysR family transcriptional regulator [Desulfuromonadales bacterium]NIS42038.1 LysR family transcriptional regulator [Desulfuromonadales bacterium]